MKKLILVILIVVSAVAFACRADKNVPAGPSELWPEIEPYYSGYLNVSDIHQIYFELCGNRDGKPVFVLHGGPGGSSSPYMRRFFNPEKFLIVLHDQRGAGKSKPYAEIRQNTTQYLVEDIEKLRKHLKLEKIILFGGSWGTTLGLAYAEDYPEQVSGMVLRGIFTATKEEIDHFYHGGVGKFFPDAYEKLLSGLPEANKRPLPDYLFELIKGGEASKQEKYSRLWAEYEIRISSLEFPDDALARVLDKINPYAFGLLENYYMANDCFLEEGQLLRGCDKLRGIPIVLVNGRYDIICPPITVYRLHLKLPSSKLVLAESSGHWMGEKNIERALLKAMRDFE